MKLSAAFHHTLRRAVPAGAVAGLVTAGLLATASGAFAQSVTVWTGYPELAPFYEHVAAGMKDEYPNLEVKVEAIPIREHERRIALGLTSGSAGTLVIELSGATARRYIENELIPPAPPEVAEFVRAEGNFNEFFIQQASYMGEIYGVPLYRGQGALFYNTKMFEEAGLSGPPATMAEYTDYAEKLTVRDANGNPTRSGWSMRLSGGGQGIAEKFWINLHQYGGAVMVQGEEEGKWKADFANEAGRQALQQYLENVHTLKTVTPEMPADAEAFEREQTAMFIRESWVIGDIAAKAPDLPYATAPLPVGSIALPNQLYVNAEGEEAEAAWAFALATNEPENLLWMLENVGWLPNRLNVDYSPVTSETPGLAGFLDLPADYTFFTLPAIGPIEEVLTRLAARLVEAYGNPALAGDDAAIDAFLAEAAAETNSILEREGILAP